MILEIWSDSFVLSASSALHLGNSTLLHTAPDILFLFVFTLFSFHRKNVSVLLFSFLFGAGSVVRFGNDDENVIAIGN